MTVTDLGPGGSLAPLTPPSPAEVVAGEGRGTTVELANGSTVELRYSMRSLAALEAEYGSLQGIQDRMATMQGELDESGRREGMGPIFTELTKLLAPGLLHVRTTHPDTGAPLRLGSDLEVCGEYLEPAHLQAYLRAFQRALSLAFGSLAPEDPQLAPGSPSSSPGAAGTTPPPSSSAAPMGSSGA